MEAKQVRSILGVWKEYKLTLEQIEAHPVDWQLEKGSKLPFGLALNKKKGVVYGFTFGKKVIDLKFVVTLEDQQEVKADCRITIK